MAGKKTTCGTGEAARILGRSHSTVYRLIEAGVLTPTNTLHPAFRTEKRQHIWEFELAQVYRVKAEMSDAADEGSSG